MKRPWLIIFGGLALAVCAYLCIYFGKTVTERSVERSNRPELAWLQMEFQLTDAQMCRTIDAKNAEIQRLLAATNIITPEIKQALAQAAEIRAECETAMLDHFYKVAQTMPPEQGKRYLDWVQQQTLKPSKMMPGDSPSAAPMNKP
jgi:hypothetical protein